MLVWHASIASNFHVLSFCLFTDKPISLQALINTYLCYVRGSRRSEKGSHLCSSANTITSVCQHCIHTVSQMKMFSQKPFVSRDILSGPDRVLCTGWGMRLYIVSFLGVSAADQLHWGCLATDKRYLRKTILHLLVKGTTVNPETKFLMFYGEIMSSKRKTRLC